MDIKEYCEKEINKYAEKMPNKSDGSDENGLGHLQFLIPIRRILNGKGNLQDIGFYDAVNDLLQELVLVEKHKSFMKLPKQNKNR